MRSFSSNARTALLLAAGLAAGLLFGAVGMFYATAAFQGRVLSAFMTHHFLIDAEQHLGAARSLAPGDSVALRQRITFALVADLPFLQSACRNRDAIDRTSACSLLRAAASYLQMHPWSTGDADFDSMIQAIVVEPVGTGFAPASARTVAHP